MQVFQSQCLKETLRRDPASTQFLQRRDFKIARSGFAVEAITPPRSS